MKEIPSPAFWLGWAGVIPFAAFAALVVAGGSGGIDATTALRALISYGTIILSFMGGVQWGLELSRGDGDGFGFLASVIPALIAFAVTFIDPAAALAILAAGFILLLVYDLRRVRAGIGPAWYGRLRLQLTIAVVLSLLAAAGLAFRA
jgi:hypothetical protein